MRTKRIFLASSDELKDERVAFGSFIRRINDIYKKRGIEIELDMWEDLKAEYGIPDKQDEYDELVKQCNFFVAMFRSKAGEFTKRELKVAIDEKQKKNAPYILIYCFDPKLGETETAELKDLKQKLLYEYGLSWKLCSTSSDMHLFFLLELLHQIDYAINIELKNDKIILDNIPVVRKYNLNTSLDILLSISESNSRYNAQKSEQTEEE